MTRNLYVYGLVRKPLCQFEAELVGAARGAPPGSVETVDLGGIHALASEIQAAEVQKRRRNLLAHTRVLEIAMRSSTVLPMRFGVMATPETLARVLAGRRDEIGRLFDRFEGRHETGLRVRWDRERALAGIVADAPDIAVARSRIASGTGTYQDRISLGRRVAELVEAWRKARERALLEKLRPHADSYSLKAPEEDVEVLRADFLVTAEGENRLLSALSEWIEAQDGAASATVVGPVPIYNFVQLRLDDDSEREVA